MTLSNIEFIADLFDIDFCDRFCKFTFSVKNTELFEQFKQNRLILAQNLYNNAKDIPTKNFILYQQNKLEVSENFNGKIISAKTAMNFDKYTQQILRFESRRILYKHYNFSIKKNKVFYKDYLKPIINFYFNMSKSTFLMRKTKVFLNEIINKELKDFSLSETKRNKMFLHNKQFSDEEVRYLVINDIFESLSLIDTKLVKQLETSSNIVNYACKKVLGETFDSDKQVEKLLKPKVSRTNTDIDTSNSATYSFYKFYIRDLDIIKEEIGVDSFINCDSDTRRMYLSNLEIDDIYFEEYLSAIEKEEMLKPSNVIAYNILQYKYSELNRDDIRQKCKRGAFTLTRPTLNKLEKLDLKLLEYNSQVYYNNKEFVQAFQDYKRLVISIK